VCHVLYVSTFSAEQIKQLIASLHDLPVLTISDTEGFAKAGGIAQFFFSRGRLNFSVQVDAAKRARLQISSRLLALATTK
ncbi:MAG: YfiR family protein, partial [Acidobacteriota bacterium]